MSAETSSNNFSSSSCGNTNWEEAGSTVIEAEQNFDSLNTFSASSDEYRYDYDSTIKRISNKIHTPDDCPFECVWVAPFEAHEYKRATDDTEYEPLESDEFIFGYIKLIPKENATVVTRDYKVIVEIIKDKRLLRRHHIPRLYRIGTDEPTMKQENSFNLGKMSIFGENPGAQYAVLVQIEYNGVRTKKYAIKVGFSHDPSANDERG